VKDEPRIPLRRAHRSVRALMAIAMGLLLPLAVATSASAAPPRVPTPNDIKGITIYWNSTPTSVYPCQYYAWDFPPNPITSVDNPCFADRVELWEYTGEEGWEFCVNPLSWPSVPSWAQSPNEIRVGTGRC